MLILKKALDKEKSKHGSTSKEEACFSTSNIPLMSKLTHNIFPKCSYKKTR